MRIITLILTLVLLAMWVFLRSLPSPEPDEIERGESPSPPSSSPTRAPIRPMETGQQPRSVTVPRDEPPASESGNSIPRASPVYPEEALPLIKPEPVLEQPEPTHTHAVPQSMIDEQNRQNDFQPQPLPAESRP